VSDIPIDLRIDLQTEDDTGLPWTYIDQASNRSRIVPGRYIVAGAGTAVAVAQVIDVDDDGLVHIRPVRGSVEANRHLLDAQPSSA
jgi:hypothetical protein